MAYEFPVELQRSYSFTGQFNFRRLKIRLRALSKIFSARKLRHVSRKRFPVELGKNCYVHFAIGQIGLMKEWIFTGIEFSVANQDKVSFMRSIGAADADFRLARF